MQSKTTNRFKRRFTSKMEKINSNMVRQEKPEWCKHHRESRTLIILLVALGFFLDYTLLTTIVPIIPEFLYNIEHPDHPLVRSLNDSTHLINEHSSIALNHSSTTLADHRTAIMDTGTTTTNSTDEQHSFLMQETVEIGFLSSSKFLIQLFTTPLVGHYIPKYGYDSFMLYGFVSMFAACIIFAFGETFLLLILAKFLQGYGAACLSVSGLTMLADIYQDHRERASAIGLSLQGLALGSLVGPLFGGVMYEFFGKTEPFLILAATALIAIGLQLSVLKPKSTNTKELIPNSLINIILDPYIALTSVTLMMANMGNTLLESILPVWMMDTMHARRWQLGAIFTPFSVCYLISATVFGMYNLNIKSWMTAMIGMILTGASFLAIPVAANVYQLISPMAILGIASAMVESALLPELGFLVDARHSGGYASVYVVGDLALCIGDTVAPFFSGILVNGIGFPSTLFLVGFICFVFSPCICLLKAQEEKGEQQLLLSGKKRKKISVVAKKVAVLSDL